MWSRMERSPMQSLQLGPLEMQDESVTVWHDMYWHVQIQSDTIRYNQIQSDTLDLTGILCIREHLSLQVHPVHPGRVSRETALSCTCCTIPSGLKLGMGRRRRWKLKPSWLLQTTMLAWVVSFWMVFFLQKGKDGPGHRAWQIRDYRKTGSSYCSWLRQVRKNGMRITIDRDSRYGFNMI